jgi:hypothetical protein
VEVTKSRWGYYPCDYAAFLRLKKLNSLYEKALHQLAAWQRWHRKKPHNRVERTKIRNARGRIIGHQTGNIIEEPDTANPLLRKVEKVVPIYEGNTRTTVTVEVELIPDAKLVAKDYFFCRKPKTTAEEVVELSLPESRINEILNG